MDIVAVIEKLVHVPEVVNLNPFGWFGHFIEVGKMAADSISFQIMDIGRNFFTDRFHFFIDSGIRCGFVA